MAVILTRRLLLAITWRRRGDHRGCYRHICLMCHTFGTHLSASGIYPPPP